MIILCDKCSLETTISGGAVSPFLKDTLAFAHKIELLVLIALNADGRESVCEGRRESKK